MIIAKFIGKDSSQGFKKNKTYYVRVRAINGNKFSSWTKAQKVAIKK